MGFLGLASMMNLDWEAESYPVPSDFLVLPFFALFFPLLRLFLDKHVFENFARRMMFGEEYAKVDVGTVAKQRKLSKFKESAWKCVYFLSAELLALYVSYDEPWFTNTKFFWVGNGHQIWPLKIKFELKGLYMYVAGFYTYSIFALVYWETRRSDFAVTMAHHVASIILVVLSYIFGFARVGAVVLALHDATDVFMEVAKMSRYSGYALVSTVFFFAFVLVWTILRIILYPFWILRSTSYEVLQTLDKSKHVMDGALYYYLFNTLLFCLFIINIYWWILMIRMIVQQIQTRSLVSNDIRSDSEDDSHDD